MRRSLAILTMTLFVLGFALPAAWADAEAWFTSTKDKTIRGIENGLFGLSGELVHGIDVRSDKGVWERSTAGVVEGLHRGVLRTLVGAYEMATPFYHDEPVLSDLDTLIKS